jgi:DNA-binding Lrp family transcriptional regulator
MAVHEGLVLDAVDFALLDAMHEHPRAGVLELSRQLKVARATVQARLKRLEESHVIAGYGPNIDCAAVGFPVQAFVMLEITQGAIDRVSRVLTEIPGVLEAFATTGAGDVICRVAASSHAELQESLVALNKSDVVVRSTSVIALSTIVPYRVLPLLHTLNSGKGCRAPAFRTPS